MTFMRKFLDMLNMENWEKEENEVLKSDKENILNNHVSTDAESIKSYTSQSAVTAEKLIKDSPKNNISNKHVLENEEIVEQNVVPFEQTDFENPKEESVIEENVPYKSNRLIIKGLHLYFIDIAREIVEQNSIQTIPLMREYHLSENDLNQIICEIQEAKILDLNRNVTISIDELERFFDIYEPSLFDCAHSVFDKEIFMVMGEIIFDKGVNNVYDSLPADEVIDYLNIMESLKILSYDSYQNVYNILMSKEEFDAICNCIPSSFSNTNYEDLGIDYSQTNFDNMSGIEFEKYCAYILSKNNFTEIKITPASGDHGIDILALKNEITYAIQCKCYSDNVGNAAVQQAHTGKSLYNKDIAVVMTNRYFTAQAIDEAKVLGVKLWDRDKLNEMINYGGTHGNT